MSYITRHAESLENIEQGVKTLNEITPEAIEVSIESFQSRKAAREMEYVLLGCATNVLFTTMSQFLKFFRVTDLVILLHMTAGIGSVT